MHSACRHSFIRYTLRSSTDFFGLALEVSDFCVIIFNLHLKDISISHGFVRKRHVNLSHIYLGQLKTFIIGFANKKARRGTRSLIEMFVKKKGCLMSRQVSEMGPLGKFFQVLVNTPLKSRYPQQKYRRLPFWKSLNLHRFQNSEDRRDIIGGSVLVHHSNTIRQQESSATLYGAFATSEEILCVETDLTVTGNAGGKHRRRTLS